VGLYELKSVTLKKKKIKHKNPSFAFQPGSAVMWPSLELESHPAFSAFLLIYSNAFHAICNFIRFFMCFLAVLSYPQPQALHG